MLRFRATAAFAPTESHHCLHNLRKPACLDQGMTSSTTMPVVLPNELLVRIANEAMATGSLSDASALARSSWLLAYTCQPYLFRSITFRRTTTVNRMKYQIELRKSRLLQYITTSPRLQRYIQAITFVSAYKDIWWMTNQSMVDLLRILYSTDSNVNSITISGLGNVGLDGRLLHVTLLHHLPLSLDNIYLNNVRLLSPSIFSRFLHVTCLHLSGVHYHVEGARTVESLLAAVPAPPSYLRARPLALYYRRRAQGANPFHGRPCEVLTYYVDLSHLEEYSFYTDNDDDFTVMLHALPASKATLLRCIIDTTGLVDLLVLQDSHPRPPFPTLPNVEELVFQSSYSAVWPLSENPWKGSAHLLNHLVAPAVRKLTLKVRYNGVHRADFVRFLCAVEDWDLLDKALCDYHLRHPGLHVSVQFLDWQLVRENNWRPQEQTSVAVMLRGLFETKPLGPIRGFFLSAEQMAMMLPKCFATFAPDFSWA